VTAATAQTVTIDRDELRDIIIDVGALWEYIADRFEGGNTDGPGLRRACDAHGRLMIALGLCEMGEDRARVIRGRRAEADEISAEESDRSRGWLRDDLAEILARLDPKQPVGS
jgi:hypothetical protein